MCMTTRFAVAILCLAVAGCLADRPVVPVRTTDDDPYAGPGTGGKGASVAAGSGSGDTSAKDAGTPSDALDGSTPEPDPTGFGRSCDHRSTSAVHASVPSGTFSTGDLLTELSFNGQTHDKCGAFRMGMDYGASLALRRTDGAVFYRRNGYIYQYVSDELMQTADAGVVVADGKSPFDNDIKLDIPGHKCQPSKTEGSGPFRRVLFKPNGQLTYTCDNDPNGQIYNQKHELLGEGGWFAAVDNEDKVLLRTRGVVNTEIFDNILEKGLRTSLKVVGDDDNCLSDFQFRAVRALASGFMMVLNNHCGLQLWQSTDKELKLISHYIYAPKTGADLLAITAHAELTPDNTFFFTKAVCPYEGFCLSCPSTYCALRTGHKEASPKPYEVYTAPDALKDRDHHFLGTWWDN